jgi:C-terminal processing protease CtpA/Prc
MAMTLLLEDAAGARFSVPLAGSRSAAALVDVTAATGAAPPLFRQRTQENYWSTLIEDSRTLYLQYNRCQNAADSFEAMARRLFLQLDQGQADRLVVDIRLNNGGDSRVDDPLISGLLDRPAWRTRGRLFALIGGGTFSSALWTADDLRKAGAILVGQPTGGKPNHYGQVSTFSLPNSRLRVGYSTRYYRLLTDSDPPSLMPEVPVEPTIDDLRLGRDPVLEAATSWRAR